MPFSNADQHLDRLIRRVLRRPGPDEHVVGRRAPGILEDSALVGDVHRVAIHRVRLRLGRGDRDAVLLGVGEAVGARAQVPFAPRRDHAELRRERAIGQLEADLVVALARRAVRDRVAAGRARHLDLVLRDQRSRERGAEQIRALVDGAALDRREHEVAHELLARVDDHAVGGAGRLRLVGQPRQLLLLTDVGAVRDHFAVVVLDEPLEDHRRVETAAVGEADAAHRGARSHGPSSGGAV